LGRLRNKRLENLASPYSPGFPGLFARDAIRDGSDCKAVRILPWVFPQRQLNLLQLPGYYVAVVGENWQLMISRGKRVPYRENKNVVGINAERWACRPGLSGGVGAAAQNPFSKQLFCEPPIIFHLLQPPPVL